jgi:hypothetical protein
MKVILSEDATSVVGKRMYARKSNSVTGFSLPLSTISGLPDQKDSAANNAHDIVRMFREFKRATVAMVVMVQPLADGISPLRLLSFGSDNRFNSNDVKNRLNFIAQNLASDGIEVLGYSADGDSRELKVMKELLQLGTTSPIFGEKATWFSVSFLETKIPFQDTIHEGAKLRTRFLKIGKILPFGSLIATPTDLEALIMKKKNIYYVQATFT